MKRFTAIMVICLLFSLMLVNTSYAHWGSSRHAHVNLSSTSGAVGATIYLRNCNGAWISKNATMGGGSSVYTPGATFYKMKTGWVDAKCNYAGVWRFGSKYLESWNRSVIINLWK